MAKKKKSTEKEISMLDNFLKEVVIIAVGKFAEEVAGLLHTRKHVNEFTIAKKLDITINQTRNILYKLADQGLVSSIRKKDKKKGWYTYFWKIEILKALEFLREINARKLGQMKRQIANRESNEFYVCDRCNIELNEETALLYDFTCNECGEIFTVKDNARLLRELGKNVDKIEMEIRVIDEEIEKERTKIDRRSQRKESRIKKEKKDKRAAKRKARMKEKEKNNSGKKKSKTSKTTKSKTKKSKKKTTKKKETKSKKTKKKPTKKKSKTTKPKTKKSKKKTIKKKKTKKKTKKKKTTKNKK